MTSVSGPVYKAQLIRKDNTEVDVSVTVSPNYKSNNLSARTYTMTLNDGTSKKVGEMTTYLGYTEDSKKAMTDRYVYIERVDNFTAKEGEKKIKNVGSNLLQLAITHSMNSGRNGNVQTTAVEDSHFFFLSRSFKPCNKDDEKIEKIYDTAREENKYATTKNLPNSRMYLDTNVLDKSQLKGMFEFDSRVEVFLEKVKADSLTKFQEVQKEVHDRDILMVRYGVTIEENAKTIKELRGGIEEKRKLINEAREERDAVKKEIATLKNAANTGSKETEQSQKLAVQLKAQEEKITELTKKIKELEKAVTSRDEQITHWSNDVKTQGDTIVKLTEELESRKTKIKQLTSQQSKAAIVQMPQQGAVQASSLLTRAAPSSNPQFSTKPLFADRTFGLPSPIGSSQNKSGGSPSVDNKRGNTQAVVLKYRADSDSSDSDEEVEGYPSPYSVLNTQSSVTSASKGSSSSTQSSATSAKPPSAKLSKAQIEALFQEVEGGLTAMKNPKNTRSSGAPLHL